MKRDIYQSISDQIVAELEQGVRPWQKPWSATHMDGSVVLPLRHNGVAYRGVNILTLWMASMAKGYSAPIWMTFKQAIDLGGCVRKGEKGSLTVYADKITRTETDSTSGAESNQQHAFARADAGAHPEYRELVSCDQIVDAPPIGLLTRRGIRRSDRRRAGYRLRRRLSRVAGARCSARRRPAEAGERFQNCRS
jgi:N-terminal domain of anti-restriction factor ArdC